MDSGAKLWRVGSTYSIFRKRAQGSDAFHSDDRRDKIRNLAMIMMNRCFSARFTRCDQCLQLESSCLVKSWGTEADGMAQIEELWLLSSFFFLTLDTGVISKRKRLFGNFV